MINQALRDGFVSWSRHAATEAANDEMDFEDCKNVLRNGAVDAGRKHDLTWRYTVRTSRMAVVCELWSIDEIYIVTCWRC